MLRPRILRKNVVVEKETASNTVQKNAFLQEVDVMVLNKD